MCNRVLLKTLPKMEHFQNDTVTSAAYKSGNHVDFKTIDFVTEKAKVKTDGERDFRDWKKFAKLNTCEKRCREN